MRDDFSPKTKDTLAKRVGLLCSNPQCRHITSGPQSNPQKAVNIGVAAHITGASQSGPRYDPNLSSQQRKAIGNGIWLCQNCAKLIDNDERKYTSALLYKWKQLAEQFASQLIESTQQFTEATKIINKQQNGKIIKKYWFFGTHLDFFEAAADLLTEAEKFGNLLPVWYSSEHVPLTLSAGYTDSASVICITIFDFRHPYKFGRRALIIAEEQEGKTVVLFVDGYDMDKKRNTPSIGKPFIEFANFIIGKMSQYNIQECKAS